MELKVERLFDMVEVDGADIWAFDGGEVFLSMKYWEKEREVFVRMGQGDGVDKLTVEIPIPGNDDHHILTITEHQVSLSRCIAEEEAVTVATWSLERK